MVVVVVVVVVVKDWKQPREIKLIHRFAFLVFS